MICPACKTVHEDGKNFCKKCGTKLVPDTVAVQPAPSLQPVGMPPGAIIAAKRREFDVRIASDPDNPSLHVEYGQYLVSVNLLNDALSCFLKAIELDPDHADARRTLAKAYRTKNDLAAAADQLHRLLETHPGDVSAGLELTELYESSGDIGAAARELERLSSSVPDPIAVLRYQQKFLLRHKNGVELARVCRRILEVKPEDVEALRCLAEVLNEVGDSAGADATYQRLLSAAPDDPIANLHLGIAAHNRAVSGPDSDWQSAIRFLDKAKASLSDLSPRQRNTARLYWASAALHGNTRNAGVATCLGEISQSDLTREESELLAWCLSRAGDLAAEVNDSDAAISLYERALQIIQSPETADKLGMVYSGKGDLLIAAGSIMQAAAAYGRAAKLRPKDAVIAAKLSETSGQLRKKARRTATILALVAGVVLIPAVFLYYGKGSFSITVSPNADMIALYHGSEEVIKPRPGTEGKTGTVRFGRYGLKVEKEGYKPVHKSLLGPFGRGQKSVKVELEAARGKVKVASVPEGAAVTVKNKYEEKTGVTPCEIEGVFALPSKIEVTYVGCPPVTYEKEVPTDETLDLGTVKFTGSFKVSSDPPGAEVRVNGEVKGVTPLQVDDLLAKETSISVQKENSGSFVVTKRIEPDKVLDLGVVPLSNLGALHVDSQPQGARVYMDGKVIGSTPLDLNNVEVGHRTMRIESPGCVPFEKSVSVASGVVTDLGVITFAGMLKVDSDPPNAEVYLDGESKGTAPVALENIPARDLRLELRIPGKGCVAREVRVTPGGTTDLGVLKVRGFAGEWVGEVGSWNRAFQLYLKEDADGRLSGAGYMDNWDYWLLVEGKASGMQARTTGTDIVACAKYTGNIRYYNLTFEMRMDEGGDSMTVKVSGGNDDYEMTLRRTDNTEYGCMKNGELAHHVTAGNSNGTGYVYCNGNLVTMAPQGRKTDTVNLTPWLKEGTNRVRFSNNYSGTWTSTFSLERGSSDALEALVETTDRGKGRGQFRKSVVFPYFEKTSDRQVWAERHGTEKYLEETPVAPVRTSASSHFGSDYSPEKGSDNMLDSAWITAAEFTAGEWLEIEFAPGSMVSGFRFYSLGDNGRRYARVKRATIECGGKTHSWYLRDTVQEQFLEIERTPAERARLRIDDCYAGKSINAVAVAEFQAVTFSLPEGQSAAPVPSPPNPEPPSVEPDNSAQSSTPSPSTEEMRYAGVIGKDLAVHVTLSRLADRLSGTYYYDKHGINIPLKGTVDVQGNVSFTEYDEQGAALGHFAGQFTRDGGIKGTWTKADGSKSLPFSFGPDDGRIPGGTDAAPQTRDKGSLSNGGTTGDAAASPAAPDEGNPAPVQTKSNEKGEAPKTAGPQWTKTFRGTIGGDKARATLTRKGNDLSGTYVYEGFGTEATLSGEVDSAGNLSLTEYQQGKPFGGFKGTMTADKTIQGTWSRSDGAVSAPFELAEETP